MRTIVTKGEFAKLKGRAPSAVSNWIAEGKLSPAALIGTGNKARIWVEQADRDLLASLDASQQERQAAPVTVSVPAVTASAAVPGLENIERKRKADADAAELAAEERRRRLMADSGRWIEAAEARRVWTQELARVVADMEIFVTTTLAAEVAGVFGLDGKSVTVEMRNLFRSFREGVADTAAAHREDIGEALAEAAE